MIASYNIPKAKVITLFGALCLFFALLEKLLPQIGFFRYGLSNLPILLALPIFKAKDVYLVMLLKVLGLAILQGTFAAHVFLLSLSGSFASTTVMLLSYRWGQRHLSLIGISVLGGIASNLVQLGLGIGFIFGQGYLVLTPILLSIGTISSITIGIFAQILISKSRWHPLVSGIYLQGKRPGAWPRSEYGAGRSLGFTPAWLFNDSSTPKKSRDLLGNHLPPNFRFFWGMLILLGFLFLQTWWLKFLLVGLFAFLATLSGKRIWFFYFIVSTLTITFFNLLAPNGAILFELGPFTLTEDALFQEALPKAFTFTGLVFLSLFTIHRELHLPGKIGSYLSSVFQHYDLMISRRDQVKKIKLLESVDRTLVTYLQEPQREYRTLQSQHPDQRSPTAFGWILLLLFPTGMISLILLEQNGLLKNWTTGLLP
jgi:uncharacterized membrane protein